MHIKENKLLQLGLYSNALYVFLLFLFMPNGINVQKISITLLLLFSVVSVVVIGYRNKFRLTGIPKIAKNVYLLILFWNLIIIARGLSFSIQDLVTNFGNVYMGLAWVAPVFLIIGLKIENWNIIFNAIFFMLKLMLIAFFIMPFQGNLSTEWTWLLRSVNLLLIVGVNKFKSLNRLYIYLALIMYVIIAIKIKQRIEFIYLFFIFLFLIVDKIKQTKLKKQVFRYILFGFLFLLIVVFTYGYENISNLINIFIEYQDSRTFLFVELFEDLNMREKITGRGSLGTYYSDFFERTKRYYIIKGNKGWIGDSATRITTEVGYLQMLLKGGFIMIGLYLFMSFYSAYLAIFKSENKFIKRLGFFILVLSILSLISFRPAFTPTFILFWISIGTVLNKKYRMMDDEEIRKLIKFK